MKTFADRLDPDLDTICFTYLGKLHIRGSTSDNIKMIDVFMKLLIYVRDVVIELFYIEKE